MEVPKVEKLDELLQNYLGDERKITRLESRQLTAAGENYGSQMLSLKIHLSSAESLDAVAKIPPPGEFIRRMFNIPVTFRNEVDFYQIIVPELKKLLKEKKCESYSNCYAEFLGGRLSLKGKNEVDDDAVLVLENLVTEGFEMGDRFTGFDHKTSKLIIKALAEYHAVPIALKLLKPKVFETVIKPVFVLYKTFAVDDATYEKIIEKNRKIIGSIADCKQYQQKVVDTFRNTGSCIVKNAPDLIQEPFATIIHTDAWVNNFMLRYQNQEPVDCKIVDFQLYEYGSPARDLIFFLCTSVQLEVLQKHFDDFVSLYYESLIDCLKHLECDVAQFSFENFQKEMAFVAKKCEFVHCVIMLTPIYTSKEEAKDLDSLSADDLTEYQEVPQFYKDRMAFIVKEFVKRNWI